MRTTIISAVYETSHEGFVIHLPGTAVATLLLELYLLLKEECHSTKVDFRNGKSTIFSRKRDGLKCDPVTIRTIDGVSEIGLGENHLGYLTALLLRAYRDGAAEIPHVHLDAVFERKLTQLTISFELYKEPISPFEAEGLMDD